MALFLHRQAAQARHCVIGSYYVCSTGIEARGEISARAGD
jgi:hypothetical protein